MTMQWARCSIMWMRLWQLSLVATSIETGEFYSMTRFVHVRQFVQLCIVVTKVWLQQAQLTVLSVD